jgi:hypothetical protein
LKIKQGFFFPTGGLVGGMGCVAFATGILATKDTTITTTSISMFLILLGLTFFSTKTLFIDKGQNNLTETLLILGFTFKTKKNLNDYYYITIIRQLYSMRSRSKATLNLDNETREYKYDLILVNKNHHNKYKIKTYSKIEDAKKQAEKISSLIHFDIVKFSPIRTRKK